MIRQIIGQRIKAERKRLGLSLEDVAKTIHLSRQTLSLIEKGKRIIDSEKLLRFAKLVEKPASFFWTEDSDNPDPVVQWFKIYLKAAYENKLISVNRIREILRELLKEWDG